MCKCRQTFFNTPHFSVPGDCFRRKTGTTVGHNRLGQGYLSKTGPLKTDLWDFLRFLKVYQREQIGPPLAECKVLRLAPATFFASWEDLVLKREEKAEIKNKLVLAAYPFCSLHAI